MNATKALGLVGVVGLMAVGAAAQGYPPIVDTTTNTYCAHLASPNWTPAPYSNSTCSIGQSGPMPFTMGNVAGYDEEPSATGTGVGVNWAGSYVSAGVPNGNGYCFFSQVFGPATAEAGEYAPDGELGGIQGRRV